MVYIIAEIGINCAGAIECVDALIKVAKLAGCNSVKFQKRNPKVSVPLEQRSKPKSTPWGDITYYEYKEKNEFTPYDYDYIDELCRKLDIEWSASVWDEDSLNFILQYNVPWLKIPSAHLTNDELIQQSITSNKPIILSTGMSTKEEISHALSLFPKQYDLTLMHCNSSYPTPISEVNLSRISTLKQYGYKVGYSGHEVDYNISISSILLGITHIEKHIILSKFAYSTDAIASLEPNELINFVKGVRKTEQAIGKPELVMTDSEYDVRKKLRGY